MAKILVFDYDGTLTLENGKFPDGTRNALNEVRDRKLAVLGIVSGREISFLKEVNENLSKPFSFLVGENGALFYFSDIDDLNIIGRDWSKRARRAFAHADFKIEFWEVIGSSKRENTERITAILNARKIEAKLAPNKNSVMVCPPNVDKGTGVAAAAAHYGQTSQILLTCFGDGENDVALFGPADVRVAVSNAVPQLKQIADVIMQKEGGYGVEEYLRKEFLGKNASM
jgi:phosphoglycolate phosphatase